MLAWILNVYYVSSAVYQVIKSVTILAVADKIITNNRDYNIKISSQY